MTEHSAPVPLEAVLALLEKKSPRPLSLPDMTHMLGIDSFDRRQWMKVLDAQAETGRLRRVGKTRFQWNRQIVTPRKTPAPRRSGGKSARAVEGVYTRVRAGYGFVEPSVADAKRLGRDIRIAHGDEGAALHGDRVRVEITRGARGGRLTGEIVEVLERRNDRVVGTLQSQHGGWVLTPESELLPPFEVLNPAACEPADEGQIALLRVTRGAQPRRGPAGEVERVLGDADDPEVQFLTIILQYGLPLEFPPECVAEARALRPDPSDADFVGREDLRELPFVTIDGETARDFDDAVLVESRPRGGVRLRVAIADVSHYVHEGSALDREAERRGTSVYFPDRALPMLPPELSTELCSLNPGRNRLVQVAEMEYDRNGHRKSARFYRGVIRSHARLTYTKVAAVLSDTATAEVQAWREDLGSIVDNLRQMHALMKQLLANRMKAGSLDLDLPEALVDLSEEGRSIGVRFVQRNDAHRLIEELMLEANRAVAEHLQSLALPLPFRVHESPEPDSIDTLNEFLKAFGFQVKYDGEVEPQNVQRAIDAIQAHPLARVFTRFVLRSMKQAHYSTVNSGHFGLAFEDYCHFTSPIRRYPDLLVHRQLASVFDERIEEGMERAERIVADCERNSKSERNAMTAERAMLDLKKAEFMLEHLLEPEAATIVGVTKFGFFAELDAYPVEGLVHLEQLQDDHYRYDEKTQTLSGSRRGNRFRLGDRILVEASSVSLRRRQIDFRLLKRLEAKKASKRQL